MMAALKPSASVTSDSVMPPTPEWTMRARLRRCRASRARRNGFDRALHVALDDQREFLATRLRLAAGVIICSSEPRCRMTGSGLLALLTLTVLGDLAGAGFVLDHGERRRLPACR
jgi:hypothetical protein